MLGRKVSHDGITKKCSKCGEPREIKLFCFRKSSAKGKILYESWCKLCKAQSARKWFHDNAERSNHNRRKWNFKRNFGISIEEYDIILERQNGRCAICGYGKGDSTGKRLAVDHNHKTGNVRGLLCGSCNNGLGRFKDDPDVMQRAVSYLLGG